MFREMRRFRQQVSQEEAQGVLSSTTSGVLALLGDEGYPYAVPMTHVYHNGRLYFHSAMTGHKVDAIRQCDKASFCVIAADDVIPHKLTTNYLSVIAFGRIRIVEEAEERREAMMAFARRYAPGMMGKSAKAAETGMARMLVFALDIEHLTGKEGTDRMLNRPKPQA